MTILNILTYPDPFLTVKARPVEIYDHDLQRLIDDMAETMYSASGVGLAATQVGSPLSLLVYDIAPRNGKPELQVMINPRVIENKGSAVSAEEGCLSVPDYNADVKRAEIITVEYLDRDGQTCHKEADDIHAIVIQHEIDHLNGILFIDRISSLKRELYKRRVKKKLREKT